MPDPIFTDPRLAAIYDVVDDDRSDLDAYVRVVDELGATSILDIGCGTGNLACRLAGAGKLVTALDPARASLEVARSKPGADRVRWIEGDVSNLPSLQVDLAVMTGNVAQVFLTDREWAHMLTVAGTSLRDGGWLVFETRDPAQRAWERWTKTETRRRVEAPGVGTVETWTELTLVQLPYVSFRHVFRFRADGTELTSDSTLRFRTQEEITDSLGAAGLQVRTMADALDRPGLEFVFLAQRPMRRT